MAKQQKKKVKDVKGARRQKGRQQGSQTSGEAYKSNSADFFRHPGQGMRGEEGGQRERAGEPGEKTEGNDTRKRTRREYER